MFTGLIQQVGSIRETKRSDKGAVLVLEHEPWDSELVMGESVAVNGEMLAS